MTSTPQQLAAIRGVARAILDAVRATGNRGTPAGVIQSGLVAAGRSYAQCHSLVGSLIRAGCLERRGDLLFATVRPH